MDFTWLTNALQVIVKSITDTLAFLGDLVKEVFKAGLDFFHDIFCWLFDQVLGLVVSIIASIDLSSFRGLAQGVTAAGSLPANVLQVLGVLGVGQALALIGAAIGIRFALQLIPFVRLGS